MAGRLPLNRPGAQQIRLSGRALQWIGFVLACLSSFSTAVIQRGVLKLDREGAMEAVSEAMKPGGTAMGWATGAVLCALAASLMIPVFAKAAYEGWNHAESSGRYLLEVFLCALFSEAPYDFAMNGRLLDWSAQNPMWGLLLAVIALEITRRWPMRSRAAALAFRALAVFAAAAWALLLRVESGVLLVLLTVLFRFAAKKPAVLIAGGVLLTLVQFPAPVGMAFVHWYDGEKGGRPGGLLRLLYPLQLTAFGLMGMLLR